MKNCLNKLNKNIIINFIIIFIFLFILELIFKMTNNFKIFDWSILRIILGVSIFSLFISYIDYFINPKYYKYINLFIIGLASIYAFIQTGFNNYIGVYMSFGASSQLGAVLDYIKEFIGSFKWYYYLNLIPLILIIFFYKKKKINLDIVKFSINNKNVTYSACLFVLLICMYMSTLYLNLMQNPLQTIKNKDLFLSSNVPSVSIKQLGVSTYAIVDIKNYFLPTEKEINLTFEETKQKEDSTRKFMIQNGKLL